MSIKVSEISNYDHSGLIIKPPHISNTPFYDYKTSRDIFFPSSHLKMENLRNRHYKRTERFMTGLYVSTLGVVSGVGLLTYNKIKNFFKYL